MGFAEKLYKYIGRGETIEIAAAFARYSFPISRKIGVVPHLSRNWHLARLYLGASGGGVICAGDQTPRLRPPAAASKEFLDPYTFRVPVAGRHEFVGRRRQIQNALRALRKNDHAGVLIHGFARQGKSSLAARIAERLKDANTIVVFGRYDVDAILESISGIGSPEILSWVNRARDLVSDTSTSFMGALQELLEGPCGKLEKNQAGVIVRRPMLLVVDDFEEALEPPRHNGLHTVKDQARDAIRSIIQAFDRAKTTSSLLITSRFRFTLPTNEREDLAEKLHNLHLPPLEEYESWKQAEARIRGRRPSREIPDRKTIETEQIARCIRAARGNPGLQELLFSILQESERQCVQTLEAIETQTRDNQAPGEENLQKIIKSLALN